MNTNNQSDKDKDLEYELPEEQFGEESEFQEEGPPPGQKPPKRGFWKRLPKKKILIGIVIIVLVALIYRFLTRQEEKALQPVEATVKAEKAPPVKAPPPPATVAPSGPNQEAMQNQVESLFKEQQAVGELQGKELQTEVKGMKQSMQGLQNSLITLSDSVEAISNQIQEIKSAQLQPAPVIQVPVVTQGIQARPIYYLKAITHGREAIRTSDGEIVSIKVDRAWLTTPNGESLSVKVGDHLIGYGCVNTINADEGWISFSSGVVIRYAPNDT